MKLANKRIEVGPHTKEILLEELARIDAQLSVLKPKIEQDVKESREKHRKLWNY